MKVSVEISKDYSEPHVVIYTDKITEEIQRIMDQFSFKESPILGYEEDAVRVINPKDIFLIKIQEGVSIIYTKHGQYKSKKKLYELLLILGENFLQISKQAIIKLSSIQKIEASFNGSYMILLENNMKEYVTRKYLPGLKNYLGL